MIIDFGVEDPGAENEERRGRGMTHLCSEPESRGGEAEAGGGEEGGVGEVEG